MLVIQPCLPELLGEAAEDRKAAELSPEETPPCSLSGSGAAAEPAQHRLVLSVQQSLWRSWWLCRLQP